MCSEKKSERGSEEIGVWITFSLRGWGGADSEMVLCGLCGGRGSSLDVIINY